MRKKEGKKEILKTRTRPTPQLW